MNKPINVAIIPWDDKFLNDRMFSLIPGNDETNSYLKVWIEMRRWLADRGVFLSTIDKFNDLSAPDFIMVHSATNREWYYKLLKNHQCDNKVVYRAIEPVVVDKRNSQEGIAELKGLFRYILTWNKELLGDKQVFFVPTMPYIFEMNFGDVPFHSKNFMVCISGDKESSHPDELYSKRRDVIEFFEAHPEYDFTLHGYGWQQRGYRNYKGTVNNKAEVYHNYKFALCFENMANNDGYITEKLWDCFSAGIVPIYYGARDVERYVPEDCFIDYRQFHSFDEMMSYLNNITEEEYGEYINAIKKFIESGDFFFGIDNYCENLLKLFRKNNDEFVFHVDERKRNLWIKRYERSKRINNIKNAIKKVIKR